MTDQASAEATSPGSSRATSQGSVGELTFHRYGKAEVRMVHVDRSSARHVITDLNVSTALRGAFERTYTDGDNSGVLPTDSQKNAVYGLARDGVGQIEEFAARLGSHLLAAAPAAEVAEVDVESYPWARIGESGVPGHDHAFTRAGAEVRTTRLVLPRGGPAHLTSGLKDLVVLKSTGSEYHGFARDRYTSLPETTERILATSVTATWTYADGVLGAGADFGGLFSTIRSTMLDAFAQLHSLALQQTLHHMATRVLEEVQVVEEVGLVMPNKHHFLVDLTPYGQDNPDVVYHADDRPYGLIEGTITRRRSA